MPDRIAEYEELLLDNEILLARSRDIGVLKPDVAINASTSGPLLRGAGIAWDIRKADPYCVYDRFDFDIPVGFNGDCYDRFIVRLEEMRQSVRILQQALRDLPGGPVSTPVPLALKPPVGESYVRIESPKGELGFYLVSDGGPAPYRFHVRSPSYINLSVLKEMTVGLSVADAIVTLGSLDINVGEIDR
jgi:NADH-quinone oxidoreductase subunit D